MIDLSKYEGMTPGSWRVWPDPDEDSTTEHIVPTFYNGEENVKGLALIAQVSKWKASPDFRQAAQANARAIADLPQIIAELGRLQRVENAAKEFLIEFRAEREVCELHRSTMDAANFLQAAIAAAESKEEA